MTGDLPARFWDKVEVTGFCWLWRGTIKKGTGYGQFGLNYKHYYPHRLAYIDLIGPIPEGMHLDHLCRIRNCVNPDHLEPVTIAENVLRGFSQGAISKRTDRCKRGHDISGDNAWVTPSGRKCKACGYAGNSVWYKEFYARK